MAKKKTTRKKTASAPRGKSKPRRTGSAPAKGAKSKKKTKKKTKKKSSAARAKSSSAARKSKASSKKKTAAAKKKTKRAPAKKKVAKTSRSSKKKVAKAAARRPKKKVSKAKTAAPKKKVSKAAGRSTKSAKPSPAARSSIPTGKDLRKAGMLDPAPTHPNDAVHERDTPARLTRKQLNHFRDLLLKRRAELIGDVQAMESGALRGAGAGDSNHAPMHMADAGSDTFDQEFALQLAATEREMLAEIDASLERIVDGTFGICEVTGKPISLPRLEAKPWAKVCIEIARERDRYHRFRH